MRPAAHQHHGGVQDVLAGRAAVHPAGRGLVLLRDVAREPGGQRHHGVARGGRRGAELAGS